jgi:hypothetical protein
LDCEAPLAGASRSFLNLGAPTRSYFCGVFMSAKSSSLRRSLAVAALFGASLLFGTVSAGAQTPAETGRGSLILDQRNDEFTLRLRQWQQEHEVNRATGGDLTIQREMQTQHLEQRQRQDDLHSRQLIDLDASAARAAPSSGAGGPQPTSADFLRFQRERAEQALRQEYELNELERSIKVDAKQEKDVPHWGPTLTDPEK